MEIYVEHEVTDVQKFILKKKLLTHQNIKKLLVQIKEVWNIRLMKISGEQN